MATSHRTKAHQAEQGVLIPAVAYVRMSSDKQEASPAQQRAELTKYAEQAGYRILRWYEDAGISGWREDRQEFQRLISDLETRHDFQAVLCWHTNRFSRFPVLEANHYWYLLDRAGVHLATVLQGRQDWQDIGSWLKASIEQHGDAQHRVKLSADVKRGQRQSAEQGRWMGNPPMGYRIGDSGRLVIGDAYEVAIVRRVFAEYNAGGSLRGLCHKLNAEHVPSPSGGTWGQTGLVRLLRCVTYTGLYRRGDVEISDCHPVIIDAQTFQRTQELLTARARITTPIINGGDFLFSGMLRCGRCEGPMTGMSKSGLHYECSTARSKGKAVCDRNRVRQDVLLDSMLAGIDQQVSNPRFVVRLRERIEQFVRQQDEAPKVKPAVIQRQLADVETKLLKAKRRLVEVDADMLPLVQEQIRALLSEQARLQDAVKAAQTPAENVLAEHDRNVEAMLTAFSELRQSFRDADPAYVREVLRQRVARVDVWADRDDSRPRSPYVFREGLAHVTVLTCPLRRHDRPSRGA